MVPPLRMATRSAPCAGGQRPAMRSHVMRGRSSAKLVRRVAARQHVEHALEDGARQVGKRRRAAHRGEQVVDAPRLDRRPSPPSAARARRAGCAGSASPRPRPSCIARVTAAQASRSPRNFGKTIPSLTASTWWPARPMRCMPLATDGGASIWMTRSTAPMSMPSSSDEVATSAGMRPRLQRVFDLERAARAPASRGAPARCVSPASSLSAPASRSARRRLLTKISVERCARTSSSSRGWMPDQIDGARRALRGRAARDLLRLRRASPCPRPAPRRSATGAWAAARRRW